MCLLRWRKYLLLAPLVPIVFILVFPGAADRALIGFGGSDATGQSEVNTYELSSGRVLIWPHVIDRIMEAPLLGHGRLGMQRTGLTEELGAAYGEPDAFPHPHNVYLEWLLDNGIVGFVPVMAFYVILVVYSARLFRDPDPWCSTVGAVAFSLVVAQLVAGVGSQHFYPGESTMGMWAAAFLALRVTVERKKQRVLNSASLAETERAHVSDSQFPVTI